MSSIKFFELIAFAFLTSLLIFFTDVKAAPVEETILQQEGVSRVDPSSDIIMGIRGPVRTASDNLASPPNSASLISAARFPAPTDQVESDFQNKPLLVQSADVPPSAEHTEFVTVNMTVKYSDGCPHLFKPSVSSNQSAIDIVPLGSKISHGMCTAVMRPKRESVVLGLLRQGQYEVNIYSSDGHVIHRALFIR
jgi:hypothetical protein